MATIDALSNGPAIVGAGTCWMSEEFAAVAADHTATDGLLPINRVTGAAP